MQSPQNHTDWLRFVFYLCLRRQMPGLGFADRGRGAKKKWDVLKNRQLFADVMSLKKRRAMSAVAACRHIAQNPEKFLNRYPKKDKTLHRQFLRAKAEFERISPDSALRDKAIDSEIEMFSAATERERERSLNVLRKN
jgi:hypothetical protein